MYRQRSRLWRLPARRFRKHETAALRFAFRYDGRHVSDGERAASMILGAEGKRLTYKAPLSALGESANA